VSDVKSDREPGPGELKGASASPDRGRLVERGSGPLDNRSRRASRLVERGSGPLDNRSRRAIFLAYHSIADDGPPILSLTPDLFERQLAALKRRGFTGGDHKDLVALATGERLDGPRAFLTFDDGFRDNFTEAFPLLRSYGFKAIVFVLPPYLDNGGDFAWPELARQRRDHPTVMRSLTWSMVETMASAGIEFASHTCRHPHLPELNDEALAQELSDSRARLKARLGRCDSIAYPFGDWDRRVEQASAAAGYSFAFTLPLGSQRGTTPLSIPRIPVDHRDGRVRFAAKLSPVGRRALLGRAKPVLRALRPRRPERQPPSAVPG